MFQRIGLAGITLSAVVLDIPDRSGRYIAKDIAAGWAYILVDGEGDSRFRGEGTCHGGRDMALRCAFIAALNCVPDSSRIRIVVDGKETHRCMVRLAVDDAYVCAAIDGRPVSVASRPDDKSVWQARMAAERAASMLLRDRERAEVRLTALRDADERMAALGNLAGDPKEFETVIPMKEWRAQRAAGLDRPANAWSGGPKARSQAWRHTGPVDSGPTPRGAIARAARGIAALWRTGTLTA